MHDSNAVECIELIVPLCETVADRIERYAMTEQSVSEISDHLDLLLMPIFQIGELVGSSNYYEELQESFPSDVWAQAYGMRNRIAHGYAKVNPSVVWETATKSIPDLLSLCKGWLGA